MAHTRGDFKSSHELGPGERTVSLIKALDGHSAEIDTGRAKFRIPWGERADELPPLLAVWGNDAVWRGCGRLVLPRGVHVSRRRTSVLESGPILLVIEVVYELSNGSQYRVRFTRPRGRSISVSP